MIFVDTWAWLALSNRKDTHHELAKKEYEEIKAAGYRIVTSDYVLDEVISALFRNVVFGSAVQFVHGFNFFCSDARIGDKKGVYRGWSF